MSATVLAACGVAGGKSGSAGLVVAAPGANGPEADYPITIGEPYSIGTITYRPADVLNYDEVGYLAPGSGQGYTAAHHTLPYPSYVEVTSLETGRTILVRVEARGPMQSNHLVSLSPAAMEQLGALPNTPVRVRRVNPPEAHRALLRAGQAAPLRMDTPIGLLEVLRRRLPAEGSASLATTVIEAAPEGGNTPPVEHASEGTSASFAESFAQALAPETTSGAMVALAPISETQAQPAAPVAQGTARPQTGNGFVVQVAAFSSEERARRVAAAVGGFVMPFGALFRVRTGPFASRVEAEASLANVRQSGYSDARILTDSQG